MTESNLHKSILKLVESNSEDWFNEYLPQSDIKCFITSENTEKYGNIKLFIFHKNANSPIAFVKAARMSGGFKSIKLEYDNLVNFNLNNIKGIPKPYYYEERNNNCFLIESFLPGILLRNDFVKLFCTKECSDEAKNIFDKIILWIKKFHMSSVKTLPSSEFIKMWQEAGINFDVDLQGKLATGTIHGDFWINNVLLDGSTNINVVDWEWCESDLPILWDILFFFLVAFKKLASYSPYKGKPEELLRIIKNRSHWLVELMEKVINEYISDFSIEKENIVPLQKGLLAYLSKRHYRRFGFENDQDKYWSKILNLWEI